ncbi:TPA: hypothetical protein N6440_002707, partial [Escherichia coli]|nr:hypothetical protein [Escherichia coli]
IILFLLLGASLIKYIFNDVEWGSFTDWISASSTAFTAWVAYKAFKAAPHWLQTKNNEAGFNHVTAVMAEYDQQVLKIQELHFDIITVRSSESKFENLSSQISKQIYETFELSSKLSSCARWKITYPKELKESFYRLTEYYNEAFGIIVFRSVVSDDRPELMISSLNDLKDKIILDSKSLKMNIEEIFTFPK